MKKKESKLGCPGLALIISLGIGFIVFIISRDMGFAFGIALFSFFSIAVRACWREQF